MDKPSSLQTNKCAYRYKQKISAYIWTAPKRKALTETTETFYMLCGQFVGPMYADALQVKAKRWEENENEIEGEGTDDDDFPLEEDMFVMEGKDNDDDNDSIETQSSITTIQVN